jgi:hypothetical protein|tara:strand:- start:275 stop:448 length:174 start_codon:yes stop_codon:yes gene_type:complete
VIENASNDYLISRILRPRIEQNVEPASDDAKTRGWALRWVERSDSSAVTLCLAQCDR